MTTGRRRWLPIAVPTRRRRSSSTRVTSAPVRRSGVPDPNIDHEASGNDDGGRRVAGDPIARAYGVTVFASPVVVRDERCGAEIGSGLRIG